MAVTARLTSTSTRGRPRRRSGLGRVAFSAGGLGLLAGALSCAGLPGTFTSAAAAGPSGRVGRPLFAESEAAPAPAPAGSGEKLLKIDEETKATTVSILGGLVGLLVGGVWLGGAAFAVTAYLARREDDDLAKALKGVAGGTLEALNFGADMNEKYEVSGKVGSALGDAVESAKKNPDSKEAIKAVTGVADGVVGAVKSLDEDVGIKDRIGTFAATASDLAYQAVDKAVDKATDLNKEYKVTDQITQTIDGATKK